MLTGCGGETGHDVAAASARCALCRRASPAAFLAARPRISLAPIRLAHAHRCAMPPLARFLSLAASRRLRKEDLRRPDCRLRCHFASHDACHSLSLPGLLPCHAAAAGWYGWPPRGGAPLSASALSRRCRYRSPQRLIYRRASSMPAAQPCYQHQRAQRGYLKTPGRVHMTATDDAAPPRPPRAVEDSQRTALAPRREEPAAASSPPRPRGPLAGDAGYRSPRAISPPTHASFTRARLQGAPSGRLASTRPRGWAAAARADITASALATLR